MLQKRSLKKSWTRSNLVWTSKKLLTHRRYSSRNSRLPVCQSWARLIVSLWDYRWRKKWQPLIWSEGWRKKRSQWCHLCSSPSITTRNRNSRSKYHRSSLCRASRLRLRLRCQFGQMYCVPWPRLHSRAMAPSRGKTHSYVSTVGPWSLNRIHLSCCTKSRLSPRSNLVKATILACKIMKGSQLSKRMKTANSSTHLTM